MGTNEILLTLSHYAAMVARRRAQHQRAETFG
jgi:hypothetical protein